MESGYFGGSVLFEGFNKDLIVFKDHHMANQKFTYDHQNKRFVNVRTGNAIDIQKDASGDGGNAVTGPVDNSPGQKWDIFYCDPDPQ